MNSFIKIIVIGLLIALFSGCVKDGEELCPPGGRVNIAFFVEKFQNPSENPLDDREEDFASRVSHLRYYIYQNGALYDQGIIDNFTKATSPSHTFQFTDLEYGNYNMVVVANSTKTALTGDVANADNLLITFPGCAETEDFFTACFPFTVDSDDINEYEVGLLRTQGLIRFTFKNMPEDIGDMEMVMKNVYHEKWVTGDYKNVCEASQRYVKVPLRKLVEGDYVISTFPTPTDGNSAYHLNVYKERDTTPYISQMISDKLLVRRNQLLDIEVTFNDGFLSFEVDMNSDWDGSNWGGEVVIE